MPKKSTSERSVLLSRVGARIRRVRLEQGLSQESLALAAGLDRSYVGSVERGQRNVAVLNLKRIATALHLTLSELLDGL